MSKSWTKWEDNRIRSMAARGRTVAQMAVNMPDRSASSIDSYCARKKIEVRRVGRGNKKSPRRGIGEVNPEPLVDMDALFAAGDFSAHNRNVKRLVPRQIHPASMGYGGGSLGDL